MQEIKKAFTKKAFERNLINKNTYRFAIFHLPSSGQA
jgi:hypothetical protein